MSCYIFDIDGTLADLTHRRQFVACKPKNWPAFEKNMHLDTVIEPVANLLRDLHKQKHTIILCSGRGTQKRLTTINWFIDNNIPYDLLFMRAEKDYRRDDIVKSELLDQILELGFDPVMVFDDRDQVVAMWRKRGLICAQVAPGAF